MTTDSRTSEPTRAQVEAAARKWIERLDSDAHWARSPGAREKASSEKKILEWLLEAAAGVAPQAESVPTSSYISPHLPGMIRNLWKSDPSENSVRTALKLAGDLIQELIDLRAANMLLEPGGPDAANEELARIKPLFENYSREYPNECNKRVKAEAERDAALAAIERVRALHVPDEYGLCVECSWEYPETSYDALSNDVSWPCPTAATLDGAPEPEWEERLAACDKHGTHCWSCTRHTERRRPAGEWHRLPVEGES